MRRRVCVALGFVSLVCILFAHVQHFLSITYAGAWEWNSFRLWDLYKAGFSHEFGETGPRFFREISISSVLMAGLAIISGICELVALKHARIRRWSVVLALCAFLACVSVYGQMLFLYGIMSAPRVSPGGGTWWLLAGIVCVVTGNALWRKEPHAALMICAV